MKRFIVAPLAGDDLQEIWLYIVRDDINAADRFLARLYNAFRTLANNPGMGERLTQTETRRFSIGSYVIYFEVVDRTTHILRIVHGARDKEHRRFTGSRRSRGKNG